MAEWEYFTCKELAAVLQVDQQTVRNWVNAGELEHFRQGRTRYIPRAAAVRLAGGTGMEMPVLYTVAQVAGILRLNQQTIRNWIDAGTFPAVRVGRRVRIKRQDLEAFIDAGSSGGFWS